MNHHDVLGVSPSASADEIKKAFRQNAKELHPDHNDSPEASISFARIKEAHDALIKESEKPKESTSAQASAAHAVAKTTQTIYSIPQPQQITAEELAHIQELDEIVRQVQKHSLFHRSKESDEIKRHRKKLKTNENRLRGKY